jgi:hypothetical protein
MNIQSILLNKQPNGGHFQILPPDVQKTRVSYILWRSKFKTFQNKIGYEYHGQRNILINIGFKIKVPIIFYLKLLIGSRTYVVGLMSNNHWTFKKIKMGT